MSRNVNCNPLKSENNSIKKRRDGRKRKGKKNIRPQRHAEILMTTPPTPLKKSR